MKDTFVPIALTAGYNVHWLEGETGVAYATLVKHYGRYLQGAGTVELNKIAEWGVGDD